MGHGFILDSATGEVIRDPGYSTYEQGRDAVELEQRQRMQEHMLERLGYAADRRATQPRFESTPTVGGVAPTQINPNAPGGARVEPTIPISPPISETSAQEAAQYERLAAEAERAAELLAKNPNAVSSPVDITIDLARRNTLTRGMGNALESSMFTPEERRQRAGGNAIASDVIRQIAGMNFTGLEEKNIDKWSPTAAGISPEDAAQRWQLLIKRLKDMAKYRRGATSNIPAEIYDRGSSEDEAAQEQWVIGKDGKPVRMK
jgi:hypothetical protein